MRAAKRMLGLGRRHDRDRLADEVGQVAAEHAPRRAVHPLDAAAADGDDADQHRVEDRARALGHQLALERERLELELLRLEPGDVGKDGDRLVEAGRAAGTANRERVPAQAGSRHAAAVVEVTARRGGIDAVERELGFVDEIGHQRFANLGGGVLGIGMRATAARPGSSRRRRSAAAAASPRSGGCSAPAHRRAGRRCRRWCSRGSSSSRAAAARCAAALSCWSVMSSVTTDAVLLARGQRRRLDPREQPALAELRMADAIAHLGALGAAAAPAAAARIRAAIPARRCRG